MAYDRSAFRDAARKRRGGCLGCLWQVGITLVLAAVLLIALTGVFYPWGFYLGGKFHILPMWSGWGTAHAKSGDYVVWIQFEPTPSKSKMYLGSSLTGQATVCTPRGERLRMHLGGSMRKHLNLSTEGEPISLYMFYWPIGYGSFIADHRPSLEFRGNWRNPDLVADDHGSIARSFNADGSVYRTHDQNRPYMQEVVPITFVNGPHSDFNRACSAAVKK
jgi:hypothetical protein